MKIMLPLSISKWTLDSSGDVHWNHASRKGVRISLAFCPLQTCIVHQHYAPPNPEFWYYCTSHKFRKFVFFSFNSWMEGQGTRQGSKAKLLASENPHAQLIFQICVLVVLKIRNVLRFFVFVFLMKAGILRRNAEFCGYHTKSVALQCLYRISKVTQPCV